MFASVLHSDAGRAAFKTHSIDSLFESSGFDEVTPSSVAGASADAVAPCVASVGQVLRPTSATLKWALGLRLILSVCWC